MNTKILGVFTAGLLILSACSVDEDYDLKKEVDMNVTVVPGAVLPIGSLETVSIGPLVRGLVNVQKQVLKKNEFLDFDRGGNLCVRIDSTKYDVEYLIDSVAILPSFSENNVEIPATFSPGWKSTEVSAKIPVHFSIDTEGLKTEGLENRIAAVKEVIFEPMGWDLSLNLYQFKKFTLKKGSEIIFPDWAFISDVPSPFSITSDHVVTLSEDTSFSSDEGMNVPITFNRLFVEEGIEVPEDSEVNLDGDIILKGDFRFSSADVYEELSGDVAIDAKATLVTPEGKFDSAEVILGETPVVLSLMTFPITLNLLTNFAGLEPYDLECEFQVESRYPIGVEYSSIVRLYNDDLDAIGEFPIGSFYGKPSIHFPPKMNTSLYFSGSGLNAPEGAMSYKIDGLLDALREKESVMSVAFGSTEVSQDKVWVNVKPGVDYGFSVLKHAVMPLRLGKDASASINKDIHGINVDTTMVLDMISPLRIKMDAVNSIPVDLNLHVEMIDVDGNVVKEYSPVVKSDIKAGTLDSPTTSEIEIGFNTNTIVPFDGVRIEFSIGGGVMTNTPLNEKQSIGLKNIYLEAPEGATVDPKLIRYLRRLNQIRQAVMVIINGED